MLLLQTRLAYQNGIEFYLCLLSFLKHYNCLTVQMRTISCQIEAQFVWSHLLTLMTKQTQPLATQTVSLSLLCIFCSTRLSLIAKKGLSPLV